MYVLWGSTFLAIGIAVKHIPPLVLGSDQVYSRRRGDAGVVRAARQACALERHELLRLGFIGILLLTTGNAMLGLAETYIPTGLAALLGAVTPLCFLVLERLGHRGERIGRRGLAGILLGLMGVAVLLWPSLRAWLACRASRADRGRIGGLLQHQLGWRLDSFQALGPAGGSLHGHRLGDAAGRTGQPAAFVRHRRDLRSRLDARGHMGRDVPYRRRVMDRLYGLRVAPASRAHLEGLDPFLRESDRGRVAGLADSARADHGLYHRRKRYRGVERDSGNRRQAERAAG